MTKELAELLDGPVAERFGRVSRPYGPNREPIDLHQDVVCRTPMWCWRSRNTSERYFSGPSSEDAEALWLAHLIGVCGELEWDLAIDADKYSVVMPPKSSAYGHTGATVLEALARATLSVPEVK